MKVQGEEGGGWESFGELERKREAEEADARTLEPPGMLSPSSNCSPPCPKHGEEVELRFSRAYLHAHENLQNRHLRVWKTLAALG